MKGDPSIVIRPITEKDMPEFIKLAHMSQIGITTMPKDSRLLENRLLKAVHSFQKPVQCPQNELYLFAAEDISTRTMIGISGIEATTGGNDPLYFFRKEIVINKSSISGVVEEIPILNPISYVRGPSELCSLYVARNIRGSGIGRLASLSRFLFISRFPERFTGSFYAELRGMIDEKNESPFWNGIGSKFFNVSLVEAMEMLKYGRSFIPHFLPKYPIYVDLLPQEVREAIGKTHPHTAAAHSLLRSQGFEQTDEIDVFDGGPKLRAFKEKIPAIVDSHIFQVAEINDRAPSEKTYIVANQRINFRACYGSLAIKSDNSCSISSHCAKNLEIGVGDTIRAYEV